MRLLAKLQVRLRRGWGGRGTGTPDRSLRARPLALLFFAAVLGGGAIAAVSSANLTGSSFEGNDGNLVVNTAGNTDWANAPNRVVGLDEERRTCCRRNTPAPS